MRCNADNNQTSGGSCNLYDMIFRFTIPSHSCKESKSFWSMSILVNHMKFAKKTQLKACRASYLVWNMFTIHMHTNTLSSNREKFEMGFQFYSYRGYTM